MPTLTQDDKLHVKVADLIAQSISAGDYHPGEKLSPVRALCEQYGVSNRTAAKAVRELTDRGVLKSIPRKGTFVNVVPAVVPSNQALPPLSRVVLISDHNAFREGSYGTEIIEEIFKRASVAGLGFRTELRTSQDVTEVISTPFSLKADEGAIVLAGNPNLSMLALLGSNGHRRVLVDSVSPHAPAVLSDNRGGMRQLLAHLADLGHRRVVFASGYDPKPNPVNDNERREAFSTISSDLELAGEVVTRDKPEDFLDMLGNPNAPTAIMFGRDDPAIEFINAALERGIEIPDKVSVTGFDDFSRRPCPIGLTTVHRDRRAMGRVALETLRDCDPRSKTFRHWTRVACEIVVRDSTRSVINGETS